MSEALKIYLAAGWALYIIILSFWLISEKRSPQATICWLLALAWLPVLGWLVYYFLGPQKIKRTQLIRSESRQLLNSYRDYWQEQITKALGFYAQPEQDVHGLDRAKDTYDHLLGFADHLQIPEVISWEARKLSLMIYNMTGQPISIARDIELLEDGGQTLDAICDAIRAAQHTVHLEYYIYEPDTSGTRLRDLLTEKARAGVKVRLLVDWLGSRKITKTYMADFLAAGGELAFFHEGLLRWLRRPVLNMRTHRKIVVCDGVVGFTGGVNITDEEDASLHPLAYHDLHLRIEGPAVYWLEHVFLEDWHYVTQDIPKGLQPPVPLDQVPMAIVKLMQVIASGPDTPNAPLWRAKLMAINMARERVWLVTPYFCPDESAVTALTSAALRGLDIRLMLPRVCDHRIVSWAARSWYMELLKAGVRIWEYGPRLLHSKTLLVDEQFSFVGTDNFDNRSFRLNFEVAVVNYERSGVLLLAQQFEKDMQSAKEIHIEDLQSVSRLQRFPEDIARLFSPLM